MRYFLLVLMLVTGAPLMADSPDGQGAGKCVKPRISGPGIWPPYVLTSDKGIRTGLAIDTVRQVFGDLFQGIDLDRPKPWTRVQHDLEIGKIDIIYAILFQPDRAEKMVFTTPWVDDIYAVVTAKGREFPYKSLADLEKKSGGYLAGVRLPEPFGSFEKKPGSGLRPITNLDGLFKLPVAGRLDYVLVSLRPFRALRNDRFADMDFTVLENSAVNIPVHMAISKQSPCRHHLDEINLRLEKARAKLVLPL